MEALRCPQCLSSDLTFANLRDRQVRVIPKETMLGEVLTNQAIPRQVDATCEKGHTNRIAVPEGWEMPKS